MMYGTVATIQVLPGKLDALLAITGNPPEKAVFEHIYKLDSGTDDYILVVGFESKEAYKANAESPEMQKIYAEYRKFLAADPVWQDGEIVQSRP